MLFSSLFEKLAAIQHTTTCFNCNRSMMISIPTLQMKWYKPVRYCPFCGMDFFTMDDKFIQSKGYEVYVENAKVQS